ncbi:site-specific integrase [Rubrimonas cliftonensis]|uniref:Phage integrase family protein n=1 Tax=Rubrimonas cliftonensis TaxID=89524 RepID=A0A1H3W791_9RHOB|nr:site-specific integrase [Rubrimonas cliftonensis]SDZ82860.1 Phage integrase family protein [Rubrimonas cliftonensis]
MADAIPYLFRRGGVWWWRRKIPATGANPPLGGRLASCAEARRAASRSVALSLRTPCRLEARRRGARLSAIFEECVVRRRDTMDGARDTDGDFARQLLATLQQQLTMAMEANARSSEAIARQTDLSRSLAEEIARRPAGGAQSAAPVAATAADYEAMFDDPEFEARIFARAEEEGWLDPESGLQLEALEHQVSTLAELASDYLAHCARKGLDPATAVPSLWFVASGVAAAFEQVGIAAPQTVSAPVAGGGGVRRAARPAPRRKGPCPTFSEIAEDYLTMRTDGFQLSRDEEAIPNKGRSFAENSGPNFVGTARLVEKVLGDRPVADYQAAEWREFLNVIVRLPFSHGKSASEKRDPKTIADDLDAEEEKAMSAARERMEAAEADPEEINEAAAKQVRRRLSANACDKHVGRIINILDHAKRNGHVDANTMAPLRWTRAELKARIRAQSVRVKRGAWKDRIYDLFKTPVFQGQLEDPGDPLFWAPLLGELAGLRLEEALQLRLRNFKTDERVPYLEIDTTDAAQRIKNETSCRAMPIHRHLIDLGLLDLVESLKADGKNTLFPSQTRGATKNKLSENFSKRFTYYRLTNGVYEPGMDFHSFRTGFQGRLKLQEVPKEIRQELMGHKRDAIIDVHYDPDATPVPILKRHIDKIELDVSMIVSPFRRKPDEDTPRLRLVR